MTELTDKEIEEYKELRKFSDMVVKRCANLENSIHEATEIYTGMEGFKPETAPENCLQRNLRQMYEALTETSSAVECKHGVPLDYNCNACSDEKALTPRE